MGFWGKLFHRNVYDGVDEEEEGNGEDVVLQSHPAQQTRLLLVTCLLLASLMVVILYTGSELLSAKFTYLNEEETADPLLERCRRIDWQEACDRLDGAGARRKSRRRRRRRLEKEKAPFSALEESVLKDSNDPSVTYDSNCLRVYRLDLFGNTTFPYHANQLLRAGIE